MSVTARSWVRVVSALTTCSVLLTGCSLVGDIRRPPPAPGPTITQESAPPVARSRPARAQTRTVRVPVPAGYDRQNVDFADRSNGAALFTRCGVDDPATASRNSCTARLFVTADGGGSWRERKHPQTVAHNQQLYVGADRSLVLLAEPNAWYVSTLGGGSFTRVPYSATDVPAAYRAMSGPVQVCCDGSAAPKVVRYANGRATQVPTAPPLPGDVRTALQRGRDQMWAASLDAGRPSAAISTDGGRTWRATSVPGDVSGLQVLDLRVSVYVPEGLGAQPRYDDLWLLGAREDRTRFPTVWRCRPECWSLVPAVGQPADAIAAAPAGDGLLAVTTASGTGLLGERWTPTDWPVGWIRQLTDGTLQVTEQDGTVWLGVGKGADRGWIELVLRQPE
jgi:hypothetical protein